MGYRMFIYYIVIVVFIRKDMYKPKLTDLTYGKINMFVIGFFQKLTSNHAMTHDCQ